VANELSTTLVPRKTSAIKSIVIKTVSLQSGEIEHFVMAITSPNGKRCLGGPKISFLKGGNGAGSPATSCHAVARCGRT
jgi:hypothetical protein